MTPKQRYQFDVTGYLHLENVLSAEELAAAREAAFRYINTSPEELPPGFGSNGKGFENGFAFDKALEALAVHPVTWPIVKELTNNKPQLMRGTMIVDRPGVSESEAPLHLHCAREDFGWQSTRYVVKDNRIFCNDFVVFPYLTDVHPGDGGVLVVPGSHKAEFPRPETLFNHGVVEDLDSLPPGVVNITPKAGDMVIISELLTHGALPWKPKDRYRCLLVLRYGPQYRGESRVSQEVRTRLSPETLELIAQEHYTHTKEIVNRGVVEDLDSLPPGVVNITPKAGDMVIISELLTHGALPWKPKDRYRCLLVLRYGPQYRGESRVSQEVRTRLSPETLELIAREHYTHTKEIVNRDVVTLSS